MAFDAKGGILKAINETNDPALKTVLLLLLGVFEEIAEKIDNVLTNEQVLKATVLNGHEPVHHDHHKWLDARIARDEEIKLLTSWVKIKMQEERDSRDSKRKVKEGLLFEAAKYIMLVGLGLLLGGKFFGA